MLLRTAPALGVILLTAKPEQLAAQRPSVTSALVKWIQSPYAVPADSAMAFLYVRLAGVPASDFNTIDLRRMTVITRDERAHRAIGVGFDPVPAQLTASTPQRVRYFIFRVPRGETAFELRMPGVDPIRFLATLPPRRI